ncbi:MAG: cupin domain-containing protein [Planctomycetota bacterium]|nr:cupin domain-containing protein [Planctomycetota bacterium]
MRVVRGNERDFEAASHEDPSDPGVLKKVLASKADLNPGRMQMLNWSLLKVGKSFRRHYHEDMQEVFVILAGQARMHIEEAAHPAIDVDLRAGDAILIEPREIHGMENTGDEDVTYLVFGLSFEMDGQTVVVD